MLQVILEPDESWSLMTVIASYAIDSAGLSQDGKQRVRRWRTDRAQGTPPMEELSVAVNEALGGLPPHEHEPGAPRQALRAEAGEEVKVELEIEEAREVFLAVLDRIVEEARLSTEDAAALRKWRTAMTPGSAGMRELAAKLNADLARDAREQEAQRDHEAGLAMNDPVIYEKSRRRHRLDHPEPPGRPERDQHAHARPPLGHRARRPR